MTLSSDLSCSADNRTCHVDVETSPCQSHMSEDPHQDGPVHSSAEDSLALDYLSPIVNMRLQEENMKLRDENAELRQQMHLTTQQLGEAVTALARAMEYIQRMNSSHASRSLQTKSQTSRVKQVPSKSIQTDSIIASPTSHVQSESSILNRTTKVRPPYNLFIHA